MLGNFVCTFYHHPGKPDHPKPPTQHHPLNPLNPLIQSPVLSAVVYIVTVAAFLRIRSLVCSEPSCWPGLMFLHFIRIPHQPHPLPVFAFSSHIMCGRKGYFWICGRDGGLRHCLLSDLVSGRFCCRH